jgi:hypothetical protein
MVDPITIEVLAGGAKIGGGILGAIRARRRGEFLGKGYDEQAAILKFRANRKIRQSAGEIVADTGGRGTNIESTMDLVFDDLFNNSAQRVAQQQQQWTQASRARVTGREQGIGEIGKGVGQAFGGIMKTAKGLDGSDPEDKK